MLSNKRSPTDASQDRQIIAKRLQWPICRPVTEHIKSLGIVDPMRIGFQRALEIGFPYTLESDRALLLDHFKRHWSLTMAIRSVPPGGRVEEEPEVPEARVKDEPRSAASDTAPSMLSCGEAAR